MNKLLLLTPLLLAASAAPCQTASIDEMLEAAQVPAQEPTTGTRVAFHVTGMMKTKSGAT